MTNIHNTVLYTGVTNNLNARVYQHQTATPRSFTGRYRVGKLVYFEEYSDIREAIYREKQIKAGSRKKKVELIEIENPEWKDLFEEQ
jgi:putative endonuclease